MEKELEQFEEAFRLAMTSDAVPMDELMRYVAAALGKRLRPQLVYLSARLFGDINDSTRRTALFVEMLHTATLIHDDVVDASDVRRGQASLNAQWDVESAVLAGDYLLAKAMMQLSDPIDSPILQEMLNVAMMMSEGELLQNERRHKAILNEAERVKTENGELYLEIITRKTARLIQGCCVCGAMSVNSSLYTLHSSLISDFGLNLGLVFQMRDDILDDDDPETTALAKQLLPQYLDKALKALDALTPYVVDKGAQDSLRDLTIFCAERNH